MCSIKLQSTLAFWVIDSNGKCNQFDGRRNCLCKTDSRHESMHLMNGREITLHYFLWSNSCFFFFNFIWLHEERKWPSAGQVLDEIFAGSDSSGKQMCHGCWNFQVAWDFDFVVQLHNLGGIQSSFKVMGIWMNTPTCWAAEPKPPRLGRQPYLIKHSVLKVYIFGVLK